MWKRSYGRATKAPPDESGNRHAQPTATAPHPDSTHCCRSFGRSQTWPRGETASPRGRYSGRSLTRVSPALTPSISPSAAPGSASWRASAPDHPEPGVLASKIIAFQLSSWRIGSRARGGTECAAQSAWPKTRRPGASARSAGRRCPRHAPPAVLRTSPPQGSVAAAASPSGKPLLRLRQPHPPQPAPTLLNAGSSQ